MKRHIFLMIAFISINLVACKKDDSSAPVSLPVEGFWSGTYSKTGLSGAENMALLIKPGGTMRYYEMDFASDTTNLSPLAKVSGNWVLNGTDLQITYFANTKTYNATLKLNAAQTLLSGQWYEGAVLKGNMILNR